MYECAVSTLAPSTSMWILEEAWNAYPHCKTVLVNGYLSIDKFRIDVETIHVADDAGNLENAVGLSAAELKERKVELLNIAEAYSGPKSEHPEWNALTFKSAKTGALRRKAASTGAANMNHPASLMTWISAERDREGTTPAQGIICATSAVAGGSYALRLPSARCSSFPLAGRGPLPGKEWTATTRPIMCAYKVVRADFKYFGMQGTVEGKIRDAQRDLFQKTLCQAYATLDRWVEKTMADVRAMETEVSHDAAVAPAAPAAPAGRAALLQLLLACRTHVTSSRSCNRRQQALQN